VAVYPLLHTGVHADPDGVDTRQVVLNSVVGVLAGRTQGLGLHIPAGAEKVAAVQSMVVDALAV
jgi:hypothetical protein